MTDRTTLQDLKTKKEPNIFCCPGNGYSRYTEYVKKAKIEHLIKERIKELEQQIEEKAGDCAAKYHHDDHVQKLIARKKELKELLGETDE